LTKFSYGLQANVWIGHLNDEKIAEKVKALRDALNTVVDHAVSGPGGVTSGLGGMINGAGGQVAIGNLYNLFFSGSPFYTPPQPQVIILPASFNMQW